MASTDETEIDYGLWRLYAEPLRFFISYSTADKVIAGKIKTALRKYSVEVFLAHEDIEPTYDWEMTILSKLRAAHIFIPIISKNFHLSKWTDQEVGIALGLGHFIIPLMVDEKPYGFIGSVQGMKLKNPESDSYINIADKVIELILDLDYDYESIDYDKLLFNSIIIAFLESDSYADARAHFRLIEGFSEHLSEEQINAIFYNITDNAQIYNNPDVWRKLKRMYRKEEYIMDESVKLKYSDLILSRYKYRRT